MLANCTGKERRKSAQGKASHSMIAPYYMERASGPRKGGIVIDISACWRALQPRGNQDHLPRRKTRVYRWIIEGWRKLLTQPTHELDHHS